MHMYVLCIDRSLLAGVGGHTLMVRVRMFVRKTEGKGWDLMQRGGGGQRRPGPSSFRVINLSKQVLNVYFSPVVKIKEA